MSFNRIISDHELLLQSLSLEDKSEPKGQPPTFARSMEDEDDAMDIDDDPMDIDDSLDDQHSNDSIPEKKSVSVEEIESDPHTGEQYHNLLALLSPTMMGARLAITHKPKLLMPPSPKAAKDKVANSEMAELLPSRTRKSSIDYEFDVSLFPTVRDTTISPFNRNMSTFRNMPNSSPFAASSGSSLNPQVSEFVDNNPVQHQPQMIHHHHYYMNGDNNQSQAELMKRKYLDQLEINRLREQELEKYWAMRRRDTGLVPASDYVNLPAPWKRNIHPSEKVPYIISSYLQLFINFIISIYFIYLVYYIVTTIKSDVNHKIQVQKRAIQAQIDSCRTLYYESKCNDPEFSNLPILRKKCETLALGMNQDPNSIGNLSSINAQIIGLILNSLVEPLGFKFFMFLLWCGIVVFGCNFVFGFVRAKTYYGGQGEDQSLVQRE